MKALEKKPSINGIHNEPQMIPFNQLRRSKKNMRTIHPKKSQEDKELMDCIEANGILQNLIVYQVGDVYKVPAGGRRLGAVEALVTNGVIPETYGIPCLVIPEEDALDASLIENQHRKAAHPADLYMAFSSLVKQGRSVSEIAIKHGITTAVVDKYLRLGGVHKTLFTLFKKDLLSLDQMMAFASTPDTRLQIATFKAMGEDCSYNARYIRMTLQENRNASDSALAQFVTLDAYREAGGAIEEDFFQECSMLCDIELLSRLAEERLLEHAAKLKGWKWVETSMEGSSAILDYMKLPSETLPTPKSLDADLQKLEGRLEELEAIEFESWTDTHSEKQESVEAQIDVLQERIDRECTVYNDETKLYGGCVITYHRTTGDLQVHQGLMRKEDAAEFQKRHSEHNGGSESTTQDSESNIKKPVLSASLTADLGLYRRSIIKAELANSKQIALNLLHYQTCVNVMGGGMQKYMRCLDISFTCVTDESSRGDYKETQAAIALADSYSKLDTGWLSIKSEQKQFAAFRALSTSKKQALVSYCVAVQLLGGSVEAGRDKLMDSIVNELSVDFSSYWRPTSDNYFNRLTIPLLLDHGKKWFGASWVKSHATQSKKAIVSSLDSFFNGSSVELSDKESKIKSQWMPKQIVK